MSNSQVERRIADAVEKTEIKGALTHLTTLVNTGFAKGEDRFDSIDKKFEDLEIVEISNWFKKRKKLKELIFSTLIKKGLPTVGGGTVLAGIVAYFTDFFKQ